MSTIQASLKQAELHCEKQGIRLTNKRKQVLSGLLKSDKAMSAYELVDYCKAEFGSSMPAMSVYRILDFLGNEHLVHKLNSSNKYVACTHITCEHGHDVTQFLICDQCQRVKEINVSQSMIEHLRDNVEATGFHLVSHQLEMKCLCEQCFTPAA
ncbi:MAG: Fur family transcriptional regulator [Thiolinea sp.]